MSEDILRARVRGMLSVKYDLGLFDDPFISNDINPDDLVNEHFPLTIESAQKSIVLLENKNQTHSYLYTRSNAMFINGFRGCFSLVTVQV